jgi:D-alanyl-D-alanine carboxypeptidase/D-alanyl-D-alanine-endopeptidase (penicillin-binding protein 4)
MTAACARSPLEPITPARVDFVRLADSLVASPPLHRAHIGIEVYDPATKRVLYAHNSERHFVPASNQKLWPTTTALAVLGPGYRYRTPVLAAGLDPATGRAKALVVVGRGDPTFSERFHDSDLAVLDSLASAVAGAGITCVEGDVIVDASFFDEAIIPGTWTFGNLNGTSAPPTGAFVVGEGVFSLGVVPGPEVGAPALVAVRAPEGIVPLVNRLLTAAPDSIRSPRRVSTVRGPWSDTLRLAGDVVLAAEARDVRLPMTDPVRFAAHAFADALKSRGITLEGSVRVVRDSAEAVSVREGRVDLLAEPFAMREVAAWTSPPMAEIVTNILQPSQNWIAEQVVRTLGAETVGRGGWREGIEVEEGFLFGTVGIDSTALSLNDGSGMSHQNLVTPHAVVQLLDYARTAKWAPEFRAALTGPGRPGTLSRRLTHLEGRVTGKTGTLSNVNALSGYVTTRDGRELIFSILSNASGLPGNPVVSAIDRMVAALADGIVPR